MGGPNFSSIIELCLRLWIKQSKMQTELHVFQCCWAVTDQYLHSNITVKVTTISSNECVHVHVHVHVLARACWVAL